MPPKLTEEEFAEIAEMLDDPDFDEVYRVTDLYFASLKLLAECRRLRADNPHTQVQVNTTDSSQSIRYETTSNE